MDERVRVVLSVLSGELTLAQTARRHGAAASGGADRLLRIRNQQRRNLPNLSRDRLRHEVLPGRNRESHHPADDAVAGLHAAVAEAVRLLGLDDLRTERGVLELTDDTGRLIGHMPAPIAVVTDNGPAGSEAFAAAFAGTDPLLRHRTERKPTAWSSGSSER
ncbi:MAG: hypothetical protein ACRDSZ_12475 [Pseudonocardiaceae bacterium]